MRSMTFSHLPGRCKACWIRLEQCICAEVPRVVTRTELLVVRHEREAAKSTGTARIAGLALPRARFVDYGDDPAETNEKLKGLEGAWLLYPMAPLAPWPARLEGPLVLLDGTWRQTRKMFKKLRALGNLPRLALPPKGDAVLRLREGHFDGARSTLEAIADALRVLEGPSVAEPLDLLHTRYVERVFRARGVWDLKRPAALPQRGPGV